MFFELKIANMLKSSGLGQEKIGLPWQQFFIAIGVFPVELLVYQVLMFCTGNWPI